MTAREIEPRNDSGSVAPVVIVGAGPVGLSMALGLARQGVRSILVEKKPTTSSTSKAPGIHVRTLEVFTHWGIAERIRAEGVFRQPLTLHPVGRWRRPLATIDFSEIADEADRPGLLLLEQGETERLLLEAVRGSGMCDVRFGAEAVELQPDDRGVTLTVASDGREEAIRGAFLVGCDGAGSFVREALGLPFPGHTYSLRPMLADVLVDDWRDDLPQPRVWSGRSGFAFAARLRPGLWRIVRIERAEPRKEEVPDEEVAEWVDLLLGEGPAEVVWASRFQVHVRSSPRFRVGRAVLAGDAAHVHSPASGFGMNGGIQDAHNLAWKLAYALRGGDTDRLLDSYDAERRAVVVETTSRHTDRLTRIFMDSPAPVRAAAWVLFRALLRVAAFRRVNLRRLTMIDLDYPPSPLLRRWNRAAGIRLPNPMLKAPDGRAVRLYDLLPNGPTILEVAESGRSDDDVPLETTIRIGPGGYEEPTGSLRDLLGRRDGWILVRPDAHVAWARPSRRGMERAIRRALGVRDLAILEDRRMVAATGHPSAGGHL
jgi:2-polyprenyl-6-methoxyphenol hydroxylase-like FAD-dependent oxidoreductase